MTTSDSGLQLVVVCGDVVSVHALTPNTAVSIGRADDNDVCVEDSAVSRKHCVVHVGPPLEIEDLGGANGTLLRSARTPAASTDPLRTAALHSLRGRRMRLAVGDAVILGGVAAVVRHVPPPPELVVTGGSEVVSDPAMRAVYAQAARAAQASLPVLVLGETGVGKDVLTRAIHRASPRAKRPFLALNCAALSETLLESELFGHEKGSFTGALTTRPGLIESADGGTVFLDEVGEMPMSIQIKLLRVLEQREVMRVGARAPRRIDVRFISATHRDLEEACGRGVFRQDLFFRLNGISLTVPPLRERRGEIAPLAMRLLSDASREMERKSAPTLSPAALATMESYAWPGNVRELRHAIERALVMVEGDVILPEHLPPSVARGGKSAVPASAPTAPIAARTEPRANDRQRVIDALAQCDGNQTRAAELLGVSRRTLINRIEEYGIVRPRKRL